MKRLPDTIAEASFVFGLLFLVFLFWSFFFGLFFLVCLLVRSGALDFEEFSALLKDMDAHDAVAKKRMLTFELPPSLLKEFSKEAIDEMRMTFGMFDESGDGALDEEELEKLLRTFGQEPTKEKVYETIPRKRYIVLYTKENVCI